MMHIAALLDFEPQEQTLTQLGELSLALVLSAAIGLEREARAKSAKLRTYALVGLASALIMLVSKYGFSDVLMQYAIVLDPSRTAAQIVSGISFVVAGLIFVRRDAARGLTTPAVIWLTAAVGMACGAGLPLLALFVAAAYFSVVVFPPSVIRMCGEQVELRVQYVPGTGAAEAIEKVMQVCAGRGYSVQELVIEPPQGWAGSEPQVVHLQLGDHRGTEALLVEIRDIKGIVSARFAIRRKRD